MVIFIDRKVLFLLLLVGFWSLFFGVHPARAAYEISDGSVRALYHFNGDSSDSTGNHNGIDMGMAYPSDGCKLGSNCALFNGSGYFDGANATSNLPFGDGKHFSISFWYQTTSTALSEAFGWGSDACGEYPRVVFYGGNPKYGPALESICGLAADYDNWRYNDGNWHYVVITSEPDGIAGTQIFNIWFDGALALGPVSPQYVTTPVLNYFRFGQHNDGSLPYTGRLDEVAILDMTIQSGTISTLWNLGDGNEICVTSGCGSSVPSVASGTLAQYRSDAATIIPGGGTTADGTTAFKAVLISSSTNPLQLQVEVEPSGVGFKNAPNVTGTPILSGQVAQASTSVLANGSYHWQARAMDTVANVLSPWQQFGQGVNVDFSVVQALTSNGTVLIDASTIYSAGTGYWPIFTATKMSPDRMFYEAPANFNIDKLQVDDTDLSLNNHDGVGNIRAWIYDMDGNPIASSTGTIYGESSCSGCAFQFNNQLIPKDFQFGLIVEDGIQGNGGFSVSNLRFYMANVREPVVIVPGVMGSYLNKAFSGAEVWPNIENMLLSGSDSYLDDLALSSSGRELAGNEMNAPDVLRTAGIVPVFKPLIDSFRDVGYVEGEDLFVAPYDWRMGIASSSEYIGAVIRNAIAHSRTGQINIVAHSMGGLVVKEYLANSASTQFLDKLILLGVPQLGAPKTFMTLQYGDDLGLRWFGLGLNKNKIKEISQNMPGIYELLPGRRYVDVAGGYVQDFRNGGNSVLSYDGTATFITGDPNDSRNPRLLSEADAAHGGLDAAPFNASNVYNVVGCHLPTIVGFNIYDEGVIDVVRAEGDGTVPEASAMDLADGFHNYFVLGSETGVDHAGLIKSWQSLALVQAIIAGRVSGTSSLPQGISTSLADCVAGGSTVSGAETTIEVSAHSPAALNAYDTSGRHTGPNALGDIEEQIPGSSYEAMHGNSFILLPAYDTYRIVADGLAAGTLTLKRKGYGADAKLLRTTAYLQIPLASASTTVTLVVGNSAPDSGVSVDLDGDGTTDIVVHPAAPLTASSSADIAPPLLKVSQIPSTVVAGATTTITFSFADAGSGIATSSATMNGRQFTSGKTVTFGAIGSTTIRFFAEDNAGNPSVREFYVNVTPRGGPSCGHQHEHEGRPPERHGCDERSETDPVSGDDAGDIIERQ